MRPTVRPLLALATLLLALTATGCGGSDDDRVVTLTTGDPSIAAARAKAQANWPEFLTAFGSRDPDLTYSVKVSIPTPSGDQEQLWLAVTSINGEAITGTIANDPVSDVGLKFGDPY